MSFVIDDAYLPATLNSHTMSDEEFTALCAARCATDKRSATIYRPGGEMEALSDFESVSGEGPVSGFTFDLKFVWNPNTSSI